MTMVRKKCARLCCMRPHHSLVGTGMVDWFVNSASYSSNEPSIRYLVEHFLAWSPNTAFAFAYPEEVD